MSTFNALFNKPSTTVWMTEAIMESLITQHGGLRADEPVSTLDRKAMLDMAKDTVAFAKDLDEVSPLLAKEEMAKAIAQARMARRARITGEGNAKYVFHVEDTLAEAILALDPDKNRPGRTIEGALAVAIKMAFGKDLEEKAKACGFESGKVSIVVKTRLSKKARTSGDAMSLAAQNIDDL